jgi:hypothetical protein
MGQWAADLIGALGGRHTQNMVNNLAAWQVCEGNPGLGANNPFNTTQPWTGSYPLVPVPGTDLAVQGYRTYAQGLAATLHAIRADPGIVAAIRSDADRARFAAAIGASKWGTNPACISGSGAAAGIQGGTGTTPAGSPASGSQAAGCMPGSAAAARIASRRPARKAAPPRKAAAGGGGHRITGGP